MADTTPGIILHNYPQSPVAEKVRVVLGLTNLSWFDVEIPRLPPKPLLTTLTGGYRRTPVMQIGADIYCDSQCIIRELDRRFPQPSLMPADNAGLMWCLSRWTDGALFDLAVKIVLGAAGDKLDPEFAADRGQLYLGNDWAEGLKKANSELPHLVSQLRAPLYWLNDVLSDGRAFLLGEQAAALDAQIYHVVWFIRGRWEGGEAMLSEFTHLQRWETRVANAGHGQSTELPAEKAIEIAGAHSIATQASVTDNDPQGLTAGQSVRVCPDVQSNEQSVAGTVRLANAETIAIDRQCETTRSQVCVHFPRSGYRVEPA